MGLNDLVMTTLNGAAARVRRDAILYSICALCAIFSLVLAVSASILALQPAVGEVYARLIPAAVFAAILLTVVLVLKLSRPGQPPAAVHAQAEPPPPRNTQFSQIAMIVEAVMLGYSLSRRPRR